MKKYFNSIHKLCCWSLTLVLLIVSSCNKDVLQEKPLDFLAPENAFNTISGIRQGITGLHYQFRHGWYDEDYNQDAFAIMICGVGTDVAYHGENPGGNRKLVNYEFEMTPTNPEFVPYFWNESYKLIQMANVLIEGIEKAKDDIWSGPEQKNAYLGEARFFRGWAYRFLVNLYGDVPLVTDVVKTVKTDFVRTPKQEVYKQIEEDLLFAAENLPGRGKEEAPGRITAAAAWNYLSETYISEGKYQDGVDAASKVIDGSGYALMTNRFGSTVDVFGSGDVYLDLFAYGNQNLKENTEAIWVIQYEPIITGGFRFPGERAFGPAYFRLGKTPDGKPAFVGDLVGGVHTGYSDSLGRPVAYTRPTNLMAYQLWQSDWKNDIRNAKHNIKRDFYFDSPGSIYDKQKIDFSLYPPGSRNSLIDTTQYIFPFIMKFADPLHHFTDPIRAGGGFTHKDVYQIRLAETILLRAEAYLGLGRKDLAAEDINKIRRRANATEVNASDVDIDYLLDERARELFGEEFRAITLRRTGKLLERVRKYCNNPVYPACNIQDYNVLFPIPQSQIDLNISSKMEQNPGY